MKPPIEFRPIKPIGRAIDVPLADISFSETKAEAILARKRALKAAQMRRYRAKRKAKK